MNVLHDWIDAVALVALCAAAFTVEWWAPAFVAWLEGPW